MEERIQSKPIPEIIQDKAITRSLNLLVLRRIDPHIEEILIKAPHVTLYQMDSENAQWGKRDVKGCLLVVRRDSAPRFQLIIPNRFKPRDPGNFVEDIMEIHEYDVDPPFLMYQNNDKFVRGILFKEPQICQEVCAVLNRILIASGKTFQNLKLSPTKSELEKLDVNHSNFREGPRISSDATSSLRSDGSFAFPDGPPHDAPNYLDNLVKQSNYPYRNSDCSIYICPSQQYSFSDPKFRPESK